MRLVFIFLGIAGATYSRLLFILTNISKNLSEFTRKQISAGNRFKRKKAQILNAVQINKKRNKQPYYLALCPGFATLNTMVIRDDLSIFLLSLEGSDNFLLLHIKQE